jgi:UPF0271 protein
MMMLNADVGELADRVTRGDEDALISLLDEANIACGGHAGGDDTMAISVASCRRHGVRINAHPSYPDREGFGRRRVPMPSSALTTALRDQMLRLFMFCQQAGVPLDGIKPHGALYHDVSGDDDVAVAFADAAAAVVAVVGKPLPILLLHGVPVPACFVERGLMVRGEVFADRGVDDDGRLLPRGLPGAVLVGDAAAARMRALLQTANGADSVCVHGDGDAAIATAAAVRAVLGPRGRSPTGA